MDFKGQKLAETLCMYIIIASAVIGFLWGYVRQDFGALMSIFGGGTALAFLVTVPDWPVYNKNPVTWLPPKEAAQQRRGGNSGGAGGSGGARQPKKKAASWGSLFGLS